MNHSRRSSVSTTRPSSFSVASKRSLFKRGGLTERNWQCGAFKSIAQTQRLLSIHSQVQNVFRVGRNHLKGVHHRLFRDRVFADWKEATCAY
jgi:hypothetical protein